MLCPARYITGCNASSGYESVKAYTECLPSVSTVVVIGAYLVSAHAHVTAVAACTGLCFSSISSVALLSDQYDAQVSVGGVRCASLSSLNSSLFFYGALPSFAYDPSVAYDLSVFNDAGVVTFSGAVQYTASPTLIGIDDCIDRGDVYNQWGLGVQCPVGTTITLHGSRFPTDTDITVQFDTWWPSLVSVNLTSPAVVNSSTITATLPALDDAVAAAYGSLGNIRVLFRSSIGITSTNSLWNGLYSILDAPRITSVTSTMCDSVSALQLTNCHALASITVTGDNLAGREELRLATSVNGVFKGYNYLSPPVDYNSTWFDSSSNTSLVYTLLYFDENTNVQLQPDVVYTMVLFASSIYQSDVSNAFRLSLTYGSASPATGSSKLSSGALAGIVIAAVVVAALLLSTVGWFVRRRWSSKSEGSSVPWSTRGGASSGSEDYKDVELH